MDFADSNFQPILEVVLALVGAIVLGVVLAHLMNG
jgi:hypothetical protein